MKFVSKKTSHIYLKAVNSLNETNKKVLVSCYVQTFYQIISNVMNDKISFRTSLQSSD